MPCYLLLVVVSGYLIGRCFFVGCSLLVVLRWLFVVSCALFVVCCLLGVVSCRLCCSVWCCWFVVL